MNCAWCGASYAEKPGKTYCSAACRNAFHSACRNYVHEALAAGFVTVGILRERYSGRMQRACTANGGHSGEEVSDGVG